MAPRRQVGLMALGFVGMAWLLARVSLPEGSLLARLTGAEWAHLVAHSVLYGTLAAALGRWWFPESSLDASRAVRARRALGASACFLAVALAQELAQSLSRARLPAGEEAFDLTVDVSAAALGVIVWSHFDLRRRWAVARALGLVLHPGVVGPLGVFALTWSALRDPREALWWTLVSVLAVLPVAAVWLAGLRLGWFRDRDLSDRRERPSFLLTSLAVAALYALFAHALGAPEVVRDLTLAGLVATALVTAATMAGLKVSGHAAVPVGVLALLQATSWRGLWPFALMALAVSWARVREGRHSPREVLAGWGIAGASGLLVRLVG